MRKKPWDILGEYYEFCYVLSNVRSTVTSCKKSAKACATTLWANIANFGVLMPLGGDTILSTWARLLAGVLVGPFVYPGQ